MSKITPHSKKDYPHFIPLSTRWMDNDIYGHVNNVIYYSYFDTIVNQYLIESGTLNIHNGSTIGLMVSSQCDFFSSISFPTNIQGGFRVNRLGNSSVEYGIAIFEGENSVACAQGNMTHVFVDRQSQSPKRIDGELRKALNQAIISM